MKRVLFFVVPLLVVISGCSDQFNLKEDKIEPVNIDDNSGEYPSSGFLNLSWADIQVLAKSVLADYGLIGDTKPFPDVAMIVNSKEKLKEVVIPSNITGVEDLRYQWPEIDFEKFSLVIGHFNAAYTAYEGYSFAQQYIVKGSSKNVLYLQVDSLKFFLCAVSNNYFATLYPKLPDGKLEVKIEWL